jgi:hypothetical protein
MAALAGFGRSERRVLAAAFAIYFCGVLWACERIA